MKPQITVVGNLTKNPILERTKTSGVPVVKFTIACNGTDKEQPVFLWCIAYDKSAENIAKFMQKGSPIMVVGELAQYDDEKKQTHTYCEVRRWGFVGAARKHEDAPPTNESRGAPQSAEPKADAPQDNGGKPDDLDDDVPF